jgi:MerR family transcriptional regulator, heat shock protein HspR
MVESSYFLLQVSSDNEYSPSFTLTEVAYRAGLHPELVRKFISLGLIESTDFAATGEMIFDSEVVPLIRRILRLRNELGVNYAGIGVILELMSRVDSLEARIRELEALTE